MLRKCERWKHAEFVASQIFLNLVWYFGLPTLAFSFFHYQLGLIGFAFHNFFFGMYFQWWSFNYDFFDLEYLPYGRFLLTILDGLMRIQDYLIKVGLVYKVLEMRIAWALELIQILEEEMGPWRISSRKNSHPHRMVA